MEENQNYEQCQQRKKWEFSKRLTLINVISFLTITLFCLIILFFTEGKEEYIVSIISPLTSTQIGLQALYFGKSGLENYQKIKSYCSYNDDDNNCCG